MDLIHLITLVIWILFWGIGGIFITSNLFSLEKEEILFAGIAMGIILENWLANILSQIIVVPVSFIVSAFIIMITGLVFEIRNKSLKRYKFIEFLNPGTFLLFFVLIILFTLIGRGLPIFDDFQNLPTVSRLATGDIPPHFALDPSLRFGYHYFLLLISAQLVSLSKIFPSVALDICRSSVMILTLFLGMKFIYRITKSRLAEFLGGFFLLFSTGIRWILLFSPKSLQFVLNEQIPLLGSSALGRQNLFDALISSWNIESGPFPFPFAFASGINPPLIMTLGGIGTSAILIVFLFLITFDRHRNFASGVVTTILMASLALADEVWFLLIGGGVCVVIILGMLIKQIQIGRSEIYRLIIIMLPALIISLLQGGMLTELSRKFIFHPAIASSQTYFDTSFKLVFPPTLISGHLGILSFNNPIQLLVGLIEIGPVIIVLPLFFMAMISAFRKKETSMMILGIVSIISLLTVFVQFVGSGGVTGTIRLLDGMIIPLTLFAVPLFMDWLQNKDLWLKVSSGFAYSASIFGGIIMFGIGILSVSTPTYGTFIGNYDVEVFDKLWNTLPKNSLVFDSSPVRAATVLGIGTRSSLSWFESRKDWESLTQNPTPEILASKGYSYVYFDYKDWAALLESTRSEYRKGCPKLIELIQGAEDIRRIYQIDGCK